MKTRTLLAALAAVLVAAPGCSVLVRERDPGKPYHYDERYDYTDLRVMRERMASSLTSRPPLAERADKPIIVAYPIENRTSEHIDTSNLMDAIVTEVHRSGRARFAGKQERQAIEAEMGYQQSGRVDPKTRAAVGKQLGARYILSGRLNSIEKEEPKQVRVRKRELIHYKLTMTLTDIETGLIAWMEEQEIVREASKPFIGW